MKRITIPIHGNIDAIKRELQELLGIDLSYAQVVDYLIKHYRDTRQVGTTWRSKTS